MPYRFVCADLIGKCRRKVILEYFDENLDSVSITGVCCDVCTTRQDNTKECTDHMLIVTKATEALTGRGEKKASIFCIPMQIFHQCIHPDCRMDTRITI